MIVENDQNKSIERSSGRGVRPVIQNKHISQIPGREIRPIASRINNTNTNQPADITNSRRTSQ